MAKKRYPNSKAKTNGIGHNKMRKYLQKYLHILKLRIRWWLNDRWTFKISIGRELTSDEGGELARWITRNVKMSIAETLRQVRGEYSPEDYKKEYECEFEEVK
jgi:hypothetical protein